MLLAADAVTRCLHGSWRLMSAGPSALPELDLSRQGLARSCLAMVLTAPALIAVLAAENAMAGLTNASGLFQSPPLVMAVLASQIARELKFHFHLEEGSLVKNLKLSEPTREAKTILKLTQDFFRDLVWESPLLRLELSVTDSDHFTAGQLSLFDKAENKFADLNWYVERLQAKLGTQQAGFADLQESYLPEKSWKMIGDNRKLKTKNSSRIFPWLRPPILFTPPKPYAPRKDARLIPLEHLAAEWWSDGGAHRRYFIAHTFQGEKLWVFWDDQRRSWFLHGTFD